MPKILTDITGGPRFAQAGSTTTIGTTVTAVTGLSLVLPAGTWSFSAFIPLTSVALTNLTFTLSPASGPTITWLNCQLVRYPTASSAVFAVIQAFNTASAGTATTPILATMSGSMVSTGSGTLSISATRTGTSCISSIGSYLTATRLV